ncbi:glutamate ligase domain-containing protein [Acanthopleuribacter pedis]|uniref:Dihydrofolate synthase/folylpolyglutamate synthase n=1 Tax=Acanthopleuribacter pedis TaxID=442870 RepID=A0A8J7Q5T4_9BACT|nr:Mur ligase family protein [Acanthopleuribacter pedis]MBO1319605.1 hypothetical protein [Acanthopleuribacter pedis]
MVVSADRFSPNPEASAFEPQYLVALDELYHAGWAARKKRRILLVQDAIRHFWPSGHPTRLIHITGTNGKGSVARYIAAGLRFTGHTGTWTSPHVFDYAERLHMNGEPAAHADIADIYHGILEPYQRERIRHRPEDALTFAEQGILLALHLFARRTVGWAVIEVGNGGRYTPQMALDVTASLLTNIAEDHAKTLGAHAWQRALEKAGVARKNKPFFTTAVEPNLSYVVKTARSEGADVFVVNEEDTAAVQQVLTRREPDFKLRNLALACRTIQHFFPGLDLATLTGNMTQHLTARFEEVAPNIIADVAHNADKIAKLAEQLRVRYPGETFHFLVGLTRCRDPRAVFAPILPLAERLVVTNASYAGQSPHEIAKQLSRETTNVTVIEEPAQALAHERENLPEGRRLVLTGSAYMIDQALNQNPYLKVLNATFGRRNKTDV